MRLNSSLTINAAKEKVWFLFMDAKKLAGCVPGCQDIKEISPTQYEANMSVKVQFMTMKFKATGILKESVEGEELHVEMTGKPFALAGLFRSDLKLKLIELEPEVTQVAYDVEIQMTGRFASLGKIFIQNAVDEASKEFAENVQALFAQGG